MTVAEAQARRFGLLLAGLTLLALALRGLFPVADPPWQSPIGITWHDEGVWAHNARNKALFGVWRTDEWNPMFVSPVFTGLEFVSFSLFGVGLWQARLVSVAAGTAATVALALGLRATASPAVALAAGLLLAVNFTWVMYSRVALLEATMIAALVGAWACYTRAARGRAWAAAAALLALVAFFTKASAAFFLVAMGLDACWMWWQARADPEKRGARIGACTTLAVLALGTAASILAFVAPHWPEYSFYNLFVYGSRRAANGLRALADRASWFPVIHQFFTRQWLLTLASMGGLALVLSRYRSAPPGERLLALWFLLGSLELLLHDLGNERRYVFLIPSMAGLAAIALVGSRRLMPPRVTGWSRRTTLLAAPLAAAGLYVLIGSVLRQLFMPQVGPAVRWSALLAVATTAALVAAWPWTRRAAGQLAWGPRAGMFLVVLTAAWDLTLYTRWAAGRTAYNYEASRAIGRLLPPGTRVQGKLANGLALDNGIQPLFIGPGFGNFADRLSPNGVEWVLTYSRPRLGFEGAIIREVLDHSPGWQVVARFKVAETRAGDDEAVLIRKRMGKYN